MAPPTKPRTPLANARRQKGLSQHQLAAVSGVPRVTIARIETRQQWPVVTTAFALADALGSTVDALFREEIDRATGTSRSPRAAQTAEGMTNPSEVPDASARPD